MQREVPGNSAPVNHERLMLERNRYFAHLDSGVCAGVVSGGVFGAALFGSSMCQASDFASLWPVLIALGGAAGMMAGFLLGLAIGLATAGWSRYQAGK